jgi:hypothetical protein
MTSTTVPRDLDRVRAVTANFFFWQGLRWVPMGAALIVFALVPYTKRAIGDPWSSVLSWGVMIVALWLSTTVLGRYYERAYGRVQGIPGQHARRNTVKWLIVYPAMFAAMILDWKLNLPFLMSGAVYGAGIEAYRRSTGGGRLHYAVGAALFGLLSLVPTIGIASSRQLLVPMLGALGALYVIGGVLDHRELVKILGPAHVEDDGSAV